MTLTAMGPVRIADTATTMFTQPTTLCIWAALLLPAGEVPSRKAKVVVASTKQSIRTGPAATSQRKGDQGDHAVSTKGRSGD